MFVHDCTGLCIRVHLPVVTSKPPPIEAVTKLAKGLFSGVYVWCASYLFDLACADEEERADAPQKQESK